MVQFDKDASEPFLHLGQALWTRAARVVSLKTHPRSG
jgi:hypothetical protein